MGTSSKEGAFVVVLNPRAGAGAAASRRGALERAFREHGAEFEVRCTEAPRHATSLTREALRAGASGVAVVGGDGTLSEALNGFFEPDGTPIAPKAWLGPLPCGTGGDFRRTLRLSKHVRPMVTHLMWARPRPIDVGWLRYQDHDGNPSERAFLNIASFGLGGLVDQLVNDTPKWMGGRGAFLLGTLRAMARYERQRVRLTLDDEEPEEMSVLNVAVANGRYFGGGMLIAPGAEIDDGRFDVVSLQQSRLAAALGTLDVYRGAHIDRPGVKVARARRVLAEPVDPDERVLLDVDGEAPGSLPATFEIKPGAVLLRA
ncbi:MAG: diacylglycerol kinase family protein [Sandaracinaceae bacterium]